MSGREVEVRGDADHGDATFCVGGSEVGALRIEHRGASATLELGLKRYKIVRYARGWHLAAWAPDEGFAAAYAEHWIFAGTMRSSETSGELRLPTLLRGWRLDVEQHRRLRLDVIRRGPVLLTGRLDANDVDVMTGLAIAVCALRTKSRAPYLRSVHHAEGRALQVDELFSGDVDVDFDGSD